MKHSLQVLQANRRSVYSLYKTNLESSKRFARQRNPNMQLWDRVEKSRLAHKALLDDLDASIALIKAFQKLNRTLK